MRRLTLSASFLLAAALPARSACHAVYSQGMRSMLAKQGYSVGKVAASFSSASECESALRSLKSQGQYQGDAYMQGTRCECGGGSGGGGSRGGASFEAQVVGMAMNAFMNAFLASMKANQQRAQQEKLRAEAKRRWEELEKVRRESEKRVEALRFATAQKGALGALSGRPAPAFDGPRVSEGAVAALLRGEWKDAAAKTGLGQDQRLRHRMDLPREETGAVSLDMNGVLAARDAMNGPDAPPRWAIAAGDAAIDAALEAGAEKFLEGSYGDAGAFGDALAAGKIGLSLYRGENAEAAAGTMQSLVSKIPKAGLATGTVQLVQTATTKVFRKSWDHFTTEVEKIVPGVLPEGGVEQWWQEMKDESSTGQRAVFEYLGL